ncbi:UNVERIFIED_CONTAM: hypothetical protein Slati_1443100 [Sesamum latifolium]|uniref:Retrotransposon gag domain-containing protein n=1 Tax=Sesamum latifolium TaxID=2727402 RepID=A0AAW2X497_9LAMI
MQGEAFSWFKWMHTNRQLSSWESFVRALELRFGPSTYDNHQAALFKLRQRGSVSKYQANFERVCNRIVGLPPEAVLNCFLSGLHPHIQWEMAILQPSSLSPAFGLARLLEAKFLDSKKPLSALLLPRPFPIMPPPPPKPPFPHCLTPAKMQADRAQGLCFNCDENFGSGHRCKAKQFLLVLAVEGDSHDLSIDIVIMISKYPSRTR